MAPPKRKVITTFVQSKSALIHGILLLFCDCLLHLPESLALNSLFFSFFKTVRQCVCLVEREGKEDRESILQWSATILFPLVLHSARIWGIHKPSTFFKPLRPGLQLWSAMWNLAPYAQGLTTAHRTFHLPCRLYTVLLFLKLAVYHFHLYISYIYTFLHDCVGPTKSSVSLISQTILLGTARILIILPPTTG